MRQERKEYYGACGAVYGADEDIRKKDRLESDKLKSGEGQDHRPFGA